MAATAAISQRVSKNEVARHLRLDDTGAWCGCWALHLLDISEFQTAAQDT